MRWINWSITLVLAGSLTGYASELHGQSRSSGLEVGGLPAINFDADEGFGYGVLAEIYQYGQRGAAPYEWSLQPKVFLTTEGRRDLTVFVDAPDLLQGGWRLDAFLGSERQIATPYYGVGNATPYDPDLEAEDGPNPRYYRFGRTRASATFNLQKPIGDTRLRWLFGGGLVRTELEAVPEGLGTTLFQQDVGGALEADWTNYLRAGLVWDSRDRQTGPTRGAWTEFIVQRVDRRFGADQEYTRWTLTDRRYVPLSSRLVFAHRVLVQGVSEGTPVYDLSRVQTSFKQDEGLGGSRSVRGVSKNRFSGRGMLIWNSELRLRTADFDMIGRSFHLTLSAFLDQGRVWEENIAVGEFLSDLHRGYGGGVRVGMGENFTVAFDVGSSAETSLPFYIGLGYLY